ncbi:MAG TPA: YjgP/YjgQ family permease [Candidatus Hydrogenedentes bacterium]|nr:YjgP/YjgQ family permease [Candidatus Hydrogenedentota bacterium]
MRLIDRYILGKIWPPAALAALVICFVVVGGAVRSQMRELLERIPMTQIAVLDILRIAFYALPTLVGYIFPITFLMGIMFVFSRLAQQNELTAMKAAGVPLKRIVLPVIIFGAMLSGIAFVVADQCQPWAYWRLMRLVTTDMPLRMSVEMLPTGVMHEYGEWRVYLGRRDPGGILRDIVILQPEEEGANAFYADRARVVEIDGRKHLELEHGIFIPRDPHRHFMFESLVKAAPTPATSKAPGANEGMTIAQLCGEERRLRKQFDETGALPVGIDLRKVRLEIKNRLAFPLMCLAVSIVGAPVGARSRRAGQSFAFTIGLAIIVAYFVLRKLMELPLLLPLSATVALGQIPNMMLCMLGIVLIWRVDRV